MAFLAQSRYEWRKGSMIYITGDTHGDFSRYFYFASRFTPNSGDVMIVLGDAGLNYYGGRADGDRKKFVSEFPFVTFCIHGNHEMRPGNIASYRTKTFCRGTVWYEEEYPNLLFAKDGEIYRLGGRSCLVIGGAYSMDKEARLAHGQKWFADEQPSAAIKAEVEEKLAACGYRVDVVLSHTCPLKYQPAEAFLPGADQSKADKSTEGWLDEIENKLDYQKWYCGHYHISKKVGKLQFMFEDIDRWGES